RAHYAYLGVTTSPVFPQLAQHFGLKVDHGAWVQAVSHGGPSEQAGLKAGDHRERFQDGGYVSGGDAIVSGGGHQIREEDDVAQALTSLAPGSTVAIQVMRGDQRKTLKVKLGERPLDAPRAG